jgi:hypothetical protein
MARKSFLKEVKGFGSKVKTEGIFAYSQDWEAGTIVKSKQAWEEEDIRRLAGKDYDNRLGGKEEKEKWQCIAEGSFSECLDELLFYITVEVDMEMEKQMSEEMNSKNLYKRSRQKLQEIKKACLTNGECKGDRWHIRSQRTEEQCEWMAQNGYPVVVD